MEKEKQEASKTKNTESREVWTNDNLMGELSQTTSTSKEEKTEKEKESTSDE